MSQAHREPPEPAYDDQQHSPGRPGGISGRSPVSEHDLRRWSESLSAVARTGLGFTKSLYERERFEEILRIAGDIRAVAEEGRAPGDPDSQGTVRELIAEDITTEWLASVGDGIAGYVTPKVAVGAVVSNEKGELLLIRRADSGYWLYPTGWADVGYSAAEVVVKEVREETGIEVEPVRLIALFDSMRRGFSRFPFYSLVFQCHAIGGDLRPHPLECTGLGWFARDSLPHPLAGGERWVEHVFGAIASDQADPFPVFFDPPRDPTWRSAATP